ncbi:hypothetical protein KP509_22G036300 [Ceratopteris richardii]|nr:hypothetical protein KP509_22G036300 [Ceratopteris richardii]KAH7306892.1 hypothetical protein KP509_22G036300 [Ceratopteris richardii]KAH7306899.1 hypothetical protein KP509_22G036300 [Ceratopteris richardii]KAH7306900.1 hypothetical protein KP509_22G036300 [Ceratopteris richardii]
MGLSVAFLLITEWNEDTITAALDRAGKIRRTFRNCYAIYSVSSNEANESFLDAYFRSKTFEIAMPPFIPVNDGQMALERMLNLADVHAECKRQGTVSQVDNEREDLVCSNDAFVVAISSIHGLTPHDANTLQQGIGSIEEIMAASKEDILDNTDLSAEKADAVVKFFHDPPFYMNPVPPSTRN